jgi:hypothetical protein
MPNPYKLGRCSDAYRFIGWIHEAGYLAPQCCWSCHEDEDLGDPLSEVDLPNGQTAEVCCQVLIALEKLEKRA